MRGGTSKGVFFKLNDLPKAAQQPGPIRDALLLRVLGSPDPYGKQIDGMGNASSSTSKAVILSRSHKANHDVDYLFGQVSIDRPSIDYSGNCGNQTAAVGSFAITNRLIAPERIPDNGICQVRIWQTNIQKTIIAHVPVVDGEVKEEGDFMLDGVAFPAAEVKIDFLDPVEDTSGCGMFPTGNVVDDLDVPGVGTLNATLINAGIPTVFVNAEEIGYQGTERQEDINNDQEALEKLEAIRLCGAVKMGLAKDLEEAATRGHTPKIAFVAKPSDYISSSGKTIQTTDIDLNVRALSMGKLHHAMMATCAVAIATASSIPNTLVNLAAGGGFRQEVCFGHPSGILRVGAEAEEKEGRGWVVKKATMSRSARVLMEGWVRVPADTLNV